MSRELTEAEVKALTELSYKKSIKKVTKELEALDTIFDFIKSECVEDEYEEEYHIVQTALKNYENSQRIETEVEKYYYKTLVDNENKKKLKAFEIIKEKEVSIWLMLSLDNASEYNHEMELVGAYFRMITQDEFDLLKEVLLCK